VIPYKKCCRSQWQCCIGGDLHLDELVLHVVSSIVEGDGRMEERRVIPVVDQPTITPSRMLAEFEMDLGISATASLWISQNEMAISEVITGYSSP
jgi:hypothetical protein